MSSDYADLDSFNNDELKRMLVAIHRVLAEREMPSRPPGTYPSFREAAQAQAAEDKDDRHIFTSGAMSSGRKPRYVQSMPRYAFERFARQRGYGDAKYGDDNYLEGARDKDFILDRINHGVEHLLKLAEEVRRDDPGNHTPGKDDAAAVMCAGMFVMAYQQGLRDRDEA